jgi:hypothetical protein
MDPGMQRRRPLVMVVVMVPISMVVIMIVMVVTMVMVVIGQNRLCTCYRIGTHHMGGVGAAAGRAHHATSISLSLSSSPTTTRKSLLPQLQLSVKDLTSISSPQPRPRTALYRYDLKAGALYHRVFGTGVKAKS